MYCAGRARWPRAYIVVSVVAGQDRAAECRFRKARGDFCAHLPTGFLTECDGEKNAFFVRSNAQEEEALRGRYTSGADTKLRSSE